MKNGDAFCFYGRCHELFSTCNTLGKSFEILIIAEEKLECNLV